MGDVGNWDKAHIIFLESLKSGRQKPKSRVSFPSSVTSLPPIPSLPSRVTDLMLKGQGLKVIWGLWSRIWPCSQKVNQGRWKVKIVGANMWRMEAVSTENTKNEVKRRALPLLKESHSWTIFVKMGPIFLSWRYRRWCFCVEVDMCSLGEQSLED